MPREKLHTAVRQEQFAEAALNIVGAYGLRGLSLARVAHRVGLVPSAIYRHFSSKDELLDAVLDLIRGRLMGNVTEACAESVDALECLRRLMMRHARLIRENEGIPRIIFSEEIFVAHPGRKAAVYEMVKGYLKRVGEIVQRGQEDGQIRPELDQSTVSLMFLGMIQPAAILWRLSDGGIDITKHVEKAWQIFSEAIRAR
jgi:AcrR family transcriptional regulator